MSIFNSKIFKNKAKREKIIDITGTVLTPGKGGRKCHGNGKHFNKNGILIECCCNECDYLLCCSEKHSTDKCRKCTDNKCPHAKKHNWFYTLNSYWK